MNIKETPVPATDESAHGAGAFLLYEDLLNCDDLTGAIRGISLAVFPFLRKISKWGELLYKLITPAYGNHLRKPSADLKGNFVATGEMEYDALC